MGSPRFWYYPVEGASLEEATITRALSRIEQLDQPQRSDVYGGDQGAYTLFRGTRRRVRLVWERISLLTSAGLADYRALVSVVSHLQRGGVVGFSADYAKNWVSMPLGPAPWLRGQTSLMASGNLLYAWSPLAVLASGDQVVVESAPWEGRAEQLTVSGGWSGGRLTLSGMKLIGSYDGTRPLARWWRCWPALRLPAEAVAEAPITNEHGIYADVSLTLEVDARIHLINAGVMGGGSGGALPLADTTTRSGGARPSLEAMLAAVTGAEAVIAAGSARLRR